MSLALNSGTYYDEEKTMKNTKALIIYHGPHCNDGMTAAWITYRVLKKRGITAELYPMNYGEEEIEELLKFLRNNKHQLIYIVDFSIPIDDLQTVCDISSASIHILDHHKSAFQMYGYDMEEFSPHSVLTTTFCRGQVKVLLNNANSGAGICWHYWNPGEAMPKLVAYVQDRDLWTFDMRSTKAIHMFINTREKTIAEWDILHTSMEDDTVLDAIVKLGELLLIEYNELVQAIAAQAVPCTIHGENGMMVNCEGQYASDVGHILATTSGTYGLTFYESSDGEFIVCSLRAEGKYDVEVLAKKFGGGGHRAAAGFRIDLESAASRFFAGSNSTDRQELQFNE